MPKNVIVTDTTSLEDVSLEKVYGFMGENGDFYLLGRTPSGAFVYNSINKTGKPALFFSTLREAIECKIDHGKKVLEFEDQFDLANFLLEHNM